MTGSIRVAGLRSVTLLVALSWSVTAHGVPGFNDAIPNGSVASCDNCHTPDFSDFTSFGIDFQSSSFWTPGLAAMDSDGDGFSNGWELQDPAGTWAPMQPDPGVPAFVSNPGDLGDSPPLPVELQPALVERTEAAGTNGTAMVSVSNVGGVPFDWSLESDVPWLEPTPAAAEDLEPDSFDVVVVQFLTDGLAEGVFDGALQVQIAGIADDLMPFVDVALTVPEPGALGTALAALAGLGAVSRLRSRSPRAARVRGRKSDPTDESATRRAHQVLRLARCRLGDCISFEAARTVRTLRRRRGHVDFVRGAVVSAFLTLASTAAVAYPNAGEPPELVGLDPEKPAILPITVQTAYNEDTMFFHISWEGDPGDYHDYLRFTEGAWRREGFPRREAQSTLDADPRRGPTDATSTSAESRATFMIDDPMGPNAVADFDRFGCFLTCHNNATEMPEWDPIDSFTKYLPEGTPGRLDLWHPRRHRGNPIGLADDQFVSAIPPGETSGGRFSDAGTSPFATNSLVGGNPAFVLDNLDPETGGAFAFAFSGLFTDPLRFFRADNAQELGEGPVASSIDYATAEMSGYTPSEGDTVPRRRLRMSSGSRGDITSFGTFFTPSLADPLFGRIDFSIQRLLDTGHDDDTTLIPGRVYDVAFAVHTGMVTGRDHYVGFPVTLSIGAGSADLEAVLIEGSGDEPPDFSDTETFPVTNMNLFLPGITSLSFLLNQDQSLVYIDPATGEAVDQNHAGANGMLTGGRRCQDCHTAAAVGEPPPALFDGGSMEALVPLRGGVDTPTPLPVPEPGTWAVQLAVLGTLGLLVRRRKTA